MSEAPSATISESLVLSMSSTTSGEGWLPSGTNISLGGSTAHLTTGAIVGIAVGGSVRFFDHLSDFV